MNGKKGYSGLLLAASMLGVTTALGFDEADGGVGLRDYFKPDPRDQWRREPAARSGRGARDSGPMTEEEIRASAEQMKRCKPQRPGRSRKSKRRKERGE